MVEDCMKVKRSELDEEAAQPIDDFIQNQVTAARELFIKSAERMARMNFVTNGAATIALLAYLGSAGYKVAMLIPLLCFCAGVVLSVMETRAAYIFESKFYTKLLELHRRWGNDEITLHDVWAGADVGKGWRKVISASGIGSQGAFVLGVVSAAIAFWCS